MKPNFRAGFTDDPRNVPLARNAIASFARICGFSLDEVDDIRWAAGEAISNAVEHGRSDRPGGFSVSCTFADDELTIEIHDSGEGFEPHGAESPPPPESPRGYGLFLMRRLMDDVAFRDNGTCVQLKRRHVAIN